MSDNLKHECGVALIRLLKPLQFYEHNYGTPLYGFHKLFLLLEKQHNRGQDGCGIGSVKLNMSPGQPYMFRDREIKTNSLDRIFNRQLADYDKLIQEGLIIPEIAQTVKNYFEFGGEVLMGHLRYGTSGKFDQSSCHPYVRRSNWPTKNLMLLGNFNMTNTDKLNQFLINRGQHPIFETDTQSVLEEIGFHLDEQHNEIYRQMRDSGNTGVDIPEIISDQLDPVNILNKSAQVWDGGYTIAGLIGNGDAFAARDPNGIRPCHYYQSDEIVAIASERVPLMTVFDIPKDEIREVEPGNVILIKNNGEITSKRFAETKKTTPCSFERIYFSRGNDPDIDCERKALGKALSSRILDSIDCDMKNTVFSFIPNTAETAFYGLMEELRNKRRVSVKQRILEAHKENKITENLLDELILDNWPRGEKIAHKDVKLRTFISQEKSRGKLVAHVYDITYGVVKPDDNLVIIDDSIVRGTTLRKSILKILTRTQPKKIVISSTAPQIRYPDCYGIDMSELGKFIAFQATIELINEQGKKDLILETYQRCCEEIEKPVDEMKNCVKDIYSPFSTEEISKKIAELVYPHSSDWHGPLEIIFQSIEDLHSAIPNHQGDWYFTGDYPTPGGFEVVNKAFIHYYEKKSGRVYDTKFPLTQYG